MEGVSHVLKKILSLTLGLFLISGMAFCKKEEPAVEKAETLEGAAEKTLTDAEKKAAEAVKTAETEVKKKATEGVNAAKDAVNTKLP